MVISGSCQLEKRGGRIGRSRGDQLITAELRIEFAHEFPFCMHAKLPGMERRSDGWWWLPGDAPLIPLLSSLKAHKD